MTTRRQQVAQQPPRPDADYRDFPHRVVRAGTSWYRQHAADLGPWWFSSSGVGRFDLVPPNGTCYLADTAVATVRERVGPDLAAGGAIAASLLAGRRVSALVLPMDVPAANLDSNHAADRYAVTGELATMIPYEVPRAWARALHDAGLAGITSRLRFSPGRSRGLALFGAAGEHHEWPADDEPTEAIAVARRMGLFVLEPPDDEQVRIVSER